MHVGRISETSPFLFKTLCVCVCVCVTMLVFEDSE